MSAKTCALSRCDERADSARLCSTLHSRPAFLQCTAGTHQYRTKAMMRRFCNCCSRNQSPISSSTPKNSNTYNVYAVSSSISDRARQWALVDHAPLTVQRKAALLSLRARESECWVDVDPAPTSCGWDFSAALVGQEVPIGKL